jgi:hypothetical protein
MSIHDKQRVRFLCLAWNGTQGSIRDKQGCEFRITPKHLSPECGPMIPGDVVTGVCKDWETVEDIMSDKPADKSRSILLPIIECPNKNEVAAYVEHLANTGKLRNIPYDPFGNHPWAVEGAIIQGGINWSVVLVPAGSRLDNDRQGTASTGPAPDARGWEPRTGTPQKFGTTPDTGRFSHPKK